MRCNTRYVVHEICFINKIGSVNYAVEFVPLNPDGENLLI